MDWSQRLLSTAIVLAARKMALDEDVSTPLKADADQFRPSSPGANEAQAEQRINGVANSVAQLIEQLEREYVQQDADAQTLSEAVAAAAMILLRFWREPALGASARQGPHSTPVELPRVAEGYRELLDESVRVFFDMLLKAVRVTVSDLAPWLLHLSAPALDSLTQVEQQASETLNQMEGSFSGRPSLRFQTRPVRFGQFPRRVTGFVERVQFTELVDRVFNDSAELTVLTGMRGSGKTQLAAAVAERCLEEGWPLVAWLNADSRDGIRTQLAGLGEQIGFNLESADPIDACLDALASCPVQDRLIVLDGVARLRDLRGLVPEGPGIRVLATTRRQHGWRNHGWDSLRVDAFDRSESIRLLVTETGQDDQASAGILAEQLGDLPLGLAQATVDIRVSDSSLAHCCEQLQQMPLEHALTWHASSIYQVPFPNALFMAIQDAIGRLTADEQRVARHQLGALSVLSVKGVPQRWLHSLGDDEAAAREALSTLIDYSVCELGDDHSVTLNPALARVIRETWGAHPLHESALSILVKIALGRLDQEEMLDKQREVSDLVSQLRAVAKQQHSRELLKHPEMERILNLTLQRAIELDRTQEATSLANSLEASTEVFGFNHPIVLTCRARIAEAQQTAGSPSQADELS